MKIDLGPTAALHSRCSHFVPGHEALVAREIQIANAAIRARGVTFGGEKEMPIALSAFLLTQADRDRLSFAARQMHGILESLLDRIMSSRESFDHYSPDHQRIFHYLRKSIGSETWQLFSRYDVVVSPVGDIFFIEGNTGCPAGFMHAVDFSVETRRVLDSLGILPKDSIELGMIRPDALIEMILDVEARSGIEPALIAILTDENNLKLELDLIEAGLRAARRQARIIDARSLTFDGKHLYHQRDRISVIFNKLRISTPQSSNHCWRDGFEDRYRALLDAVRTGAVVSINSLASLTVAEDKGMLAHLHDPTLRAILSPAERDFVDEMIPWTARLVAGKVFRRGDWIDPIDFARTHRDSLVIKPAHEGRGFEVHIGRETRDSDWRRLTTLNPAMPMVIQEFIEPMTLPVHCLRDGGIQREQMHLTLALAVLDGKYEGILSRISPSMVTNVGRQGFVQAVFIENGD